MLIDFLNGLDNGRRFARFPVALATQRCCSSCERRNISCSVFLHCGRLHLKRSFQEKDKNKVLRIKVKEVKEMFLFFVLLFTEREITE